MNERIKLVYLVFALYRPSGLERVLTQKANWLASTGRYDITIITARQKGRQVAFELHPDIRLIDIGVNFYTFFGKLFYRIRLAKLLRKLSPDITDSACGPCIPYLPYMKFPGVKMCEFHFSHHSLFNSDMKRSRSRAYRDAVRKLDCFVVLTKDDMNDWAPYSDRTVFIPNSCDIEGNADLTSTHVMLSGRLEKQKNVADAVKAWEIVARSHPDWTLDIFGEGSHEHMLREQIAEASLEDKVILHGNVKDIFQQMQRCSVMILTSSYEGLPMCLLEGAASGMPIVSYDCKCGPGEIVADTESGFLVSVGDYERLAEKINLLIEDPRLRSAMGAKAKERSKNFLSGPIMERWDELFKDLSSGRK